MKASRTAVAHIMAQQTLRSGVSEHSAQALAAYLLEEGRTNELASIMRDIQAAWAEAGYVEVIAQSAHELSPTDLKDIETEARRLHPQGRISITTHLQPDLVGGVRVSIIDKQLDLTTRAKLQLFKRLAVHGKE